VLLLLLHHLHCHVLALFPVYCATLHKHKHKIRASLSEWSKYRALDDFRSLEAEGVRLVWLTFHLVVLRQHTIVEEIIRREVEVELEALQFN
jgi:hypothetical protein